MQLNSLPDAALQVQLPDGRRLGYAQYGRCDGRPVLYCHGGLSCRLDIAFAQQQAYELGILIIAPDRSGVGLSDRNYKRTLTSVAEDIGHLLNVLEVPTLPVLGWSLGAPYALACGYQLGERITSIATVGGIGPLDRPGAVQELGMIEDQILLAWPEGIRWAMGVGLELCTKLPPNFVKYSLESHLTSKSDLEVVAALSPEDATQFFYASMKNGAGGHLDDYGSVANWNFPIEQIKQPVQVWQGSEDNLCPAGAAADLVARIPGSELHEVADRGHFMLHRNFKDIMMSMLL